MPVTPGDKPWDGLCMGDGIGWGGPLCLDDDPVLGGIDAPAADGSTRYPLGRVHSPVTAEIAARLRAIAALGPQRDDRVFIKVGDSISASYAVMSCFAGDEIELDGRDELRPALSYLLDADIGGAPTDCAEDWCAGARTAFNRKSYAAEGGATADFPLVGSPAPLALEVEAVSPRYALLQFGTNDSVVITGRSDTPLFDTYFESMTALVDYLSVRGIVTLLYTIPPYVPPRAGHANVTTLNAIVRGIAQGAGLPLIDFHLESLALPDYGLWDGTHPSVEYGGCVFTPEGLQHGHNLRNLLSMQALARMHAVLTEGEEALDTPGAPLAGSGTGASPYVIDALPFVDTRDNSAAAENRTDTYKSCGVAGATGKEIYYRLTLDAPARIRALALDRGAVRARVSILAGTSPDDSCLSSSLDAAHAGLGPGTYSIIVDSTAETAGELLLVVLACEPNDPTCA